MKLGSFCGEIGLAFLVGWGVIKSDGQARSSLRTLICL